MEGSTVSPPPTSPIEGDDPCETAVSNVAIHSVTLLACLCGLPGNGAVLWLLRINAIGDFIFNQAVTDFLFLLFMVPSALLFLLEDVSCSSILPLVYLSFLFQLSLLSYDMGLYRLTELSIGRCTSVLCPLCCGCRLPLRLSWLLRSVLSWAVYFTVIAVLYMVASLCQSQQQKHCRAALISMYALNLLLCAASMVISSTILFLNFKSGSQQQQPKRLDSVIFLTALFALPLSLWNFLQQFGYSPVPSHVFFLLTCIHGSIKPFIYFSVGSSWRHRSMGSFWRHCSMESLRDSLRRVFEEPEENTPSSNDPTMDTAVPSY